MASSVGPKNDPISQMPKELQKTVASFFSAEDAGKDANVSKLFKEVTDDPKLWKALGEKMNIQVNLKSAKEDLIRGIEMKVNKLMFQFMGFRPADHLPFTQQRQEIEKFLARQDFTIPYVETGDAHSHKMRNYLNELIGILKNEQINLTLENRTVYRRVVLLLINQGVPIVDKRQIYGLKLDTEIFNAYLSVKKKKQENLNEELSGVLKMTTYVNPQFISALITAGARPKDTDLPLVITKMAYEPQNHAVLKPILDMCSKTVDKRALDDTLEHLQKLVKERRFDSKGKPIETAEIFLTAEIERMRDEVLMYLQERSELYSLAAPPRDDE